MKTGNSKELVIWNISMSGSSHFIVDFWKISPNSISETVGDIEASRIVMSSCTIVEMTYSSLGTVKVLDYALLEINEAGTGHRFELRVNTERGSIVVRSVYAAEFKPQPVLPM